jgi:membrane fusion protein (multidrug efflux system)
MGTFALSLRENPATLATNHAGRGKAPAGFDIESDVMRHTVAVVAVALLAVAGGGAYWYLNEGPGIAGATRILASLGLASGRAATPAPGAATPQAATAVEVAKVRLGSARSTVLAVGSFRSNEAVMIRPELASRIKAFNFNEGEKVKQGDVLVRLDAALDEAQLAQAEAALVLSKANFERAMTLMQRQAGTERAVDEARHALRRDEAAVQLAQTRVEKYTLVAPFDGIVGLRRVSVGSFLGPGADIINLEQIDPLKVDFRVPEVFLAAVAVGQPITVSVDAFQSREFVGKVYAIDPLVDEAGRAVVIRARVDNPGDVLRPGVFARVSLTLSLRENAMFVPEHAIVPVGDRVQVYRVVDGKSAPTFVRIGQRSGSDVEVLEGLKADDVVIVAGQLKLPPRPVPVRVVPGATPRQASGTTGPAPADASPAGGAGDRGG